MLDEISRITSSENAESRRITQMQSQIKFAQLKLQNLQDFGSLGNRSLLADMENFSVQAMA